MATILQHIQLIVMYSISNEIEHMWIPQALADDKSTSHQAIGTGTVRLQDITEDEGAISRHTISLYHNELNRISAVAPFMIISMHPVKL